MTKISVSKMLFINSFKMTKTRLSSDILDNFIQHAVALMQLCTTRCCAYIQHTVVQTSLRTTRRRWKYVFQCTFIFHPCLRAGLHISACTVWYLRTRLPTRLQRHIVQSCVSATACSAKSRRRVVCRRDGVLCKVALARRLVVQIVLARRRVVCNSNGLLCVSA